MSALPSLPGNQPASPFFTLFAGPEGHLGIPEKGGERPFSLDTLSAIHLWGRSGGGRCRTLSENFRKLCAEVPHSFLTRSNAFLQNSAKKVPQNFHRSFRKNPFANDPIIKWTGDKPHLLNPHLRHSKFLIVSWTAADKPHHLFDDFLTFLTFLTFFALREKSREVSKVFFDTFWRFLTWPLGWAKTRMASRKN